MLLFILSPAPSYLTRAFLSLRLRPIRVSVVFSLPRLKSRSASCIIDDMPEWRNGRRRGLKIPRSLTVRVRVPPSAPPKNTDFDTKSVFFLFARKARNCAVFGRFAVWTPRPDTIPRSVTKTVVTPKVLFSALCQRLLPFFHHLPYRLATVLPA